MRNEINKNIEKIIEPLFTKKSLAESVEKHVRKDGMGYAEAMIHICKENELDPEDLAKLVSPPLKEKIKIEAENLSLLPKSNTSTLLFK